MNKYLFYLRSGYIATVYILKDWELGELGAVMKRLKPVKVERIE